MDAPRETGGGTAGPAGHARRAAGGGAVARERTGSGAERRARGDRLESSSSRRASRRARRPCPATRISCQTSFSPATASLDVVIQPNGRIVAGGRAANLGGQFAFARYRPNGSLDTTFSNDGKRFLNFSAGDDIARSLALQADGKIVAAGGELENDPLGRGRFALARLHPNGTLDLDETTDFDMPFFSDQAQGVALQQDGKIVAVGDAGSQLGLVRYESNGELDDTFDGDGRVITSRGGSLKSVAIQADGRIVAAGWSADSLFLARYGAEGAPDGTFGAGGVVLTNLGNDDARWTIAEGMAIQTDGRIVAGGSQSDGRSRFVVARFLAE